MQRHLDLIDRLLADKDTLSKQLDEAQTSVAAQEARCAATVDALKAGWAQELRKQRDQWMAAEKVLPCFCPLCAFMSLHQTEYFW
jgi:hypothetical protein